MSVSAPGGHFHVPDALFGGHLAGTGQHVRFGIHSGHGTHPQAMGKASCPVPQPTSITTSSLARLKAPMSVSITAGG